MKREINFDELLDKLEEAHRFAHDITKIMEMRNFTQGHFLAVITILKLAFVVDLFANDYSESEIKEILSNSEKIIAKAFSPNKKPLDEL